MLHPVQFMNTVADKVVSKVGDAGDDLGLLDSTGFSRDARGAETAGKSQNVAKRRKAIRQASHPDTPLSRGDNDFSVQQDYTDPPYAHKDR